MFGKHLLIVDEGICGNGMGSYIDSKVMLMFMTIFLWGKECESVDSSAIYTFFTKKKGRNYIMP